MKFYELHSSSKIIRAMKSRKTRQAGNVARVGARRGVYRGFVGRPEERKTLGRPKGKWEGSGKIDLQDVGSGMDQADLAQGKDKWRVVLNALINSWSP
jgi:hypothetical protein